MSHLDDDKKNMLIGAVIGGIVGIGASVLIASLHGKSKGSPLNKIGKTMCQLGEMLEEGHISHPSSHENNTLANVVEWAAMGLHLWKKIQKGA